MKNIGKYFMVLIFVIIGMFCGIIIQKVASTMFTGTESIEFVLLIYVFLFAMMYVGIVLQIAIHEAGHLVFGLLTGYHFVSYRIFSWIWIKQNDKIVLKRFNLGGTGGQCLLNPPGDINDDYPVILYNLGGSIMNLFTALVFFILARVFAGQPIVWASFLMLAISGLGFGIANGIPVRMVVNNDGWNTLDLIRNPMAKRAFWVQMKVAALTSNDVPLNKMPAEWFAIPEDKDLKNGIVTYIATAAADRLIYEGKEDEAYALRKDLLAKDTGMPELFRLLMKEENIFYELTHDYPLDDIKNAHDPQFTKSIRPFLTMLNVLKTECIYALVVENDIDKANMLQQQFDKVADSYPYAVEIHLERSLLDQALFQFGYYAL